MNPLQPGQSIGIIGGGQLGRMIAAAAHRLGFQVALLCHRADCPAAPLCDRVFVEHPSSTEPLERFLASSDVVTYETENVAPDVLSAVESHIPRPHTEIIRIAQDRNAEKAFLSQHGFAVVPHAPIASTTSTAQLPDDLFPGIVKTTVGGYDGKGQWVVENESDLLDALSELGSRLAVLERRIDLAAEFSLIAARNPGGQFASYPAFANTHQSQILDHTVCPGDVPNGLVEQATAQMQTLMHSVDYVGLLCIEFFVDRQQDLWVNEMAPRPHNSGHLSLDASATDQFEQLVRAIAGLPLGSAAMLRPAAMVNILGEVFLNAANQQPNWAHALSIAGTHLHLYGKADARRGRKMGHITALADSPQEALNRAIRARKRLHANPCSTPVRPV